MKHVLIVDDEAISRDSLIFALKNNHVIHSANSSEEALKWLKSNRVDLITLDIMMPGKTGLEALKEIRSFHPDTPVIMVSGDASEDARVQSSKYGAVGFIQKPFDLSEIRSLAHWALDCAHARRHLLALTGNLQGETYVHNLISESHAMKSLLQDCREASENSTPLIICGERGTGKETLARFIHSSGPLRDNPICVIPAIHHTADSLNSRLCGRAGSLDGGVYDLTASGTLVITEITEASLEAQELLANHLVNRSFCRPQDDSAIPISSRMIITTSENLKKQSEDGKIHPLLLNFINQSCRKLDSIPLRNRQEDLPMLIYHFLNSLQQSMTSQSKDIDGEAMQQMRKYPWPGNLRELRNVIERMILNAPQSPTLKMNHLPSELQTPSSAITRTRVSNFEEAVSSFERELIVNALRECNGIQAKAADLLGTTRRILNYRIAKLNIRTTAE